MALTKNQAINWINESIGKYYNPDGAYGYQCKDYADAYATALFGDWANTLRPNDAKFVFDGSNGDFFEKIRNNPDPNLIPESGDIIIYDGWSGNPYGHIEVVLNSNNQGVEVVYQDGFAQIPATKTFRPYGQLPIIGWLRPKFNPEIPTKQDNSWREVSSEIGVNVRNEPNTTSGIFATYPKGSEIQMKGYCKGQKIEDSDIWFITARSSKFIHISAMNKGVEDLPHLADFDNIEVLPNKKQEIQTPPPEIKQEFLTFEKDFDFVDRVEPIATENQFYGRKNLKDNGEYFSQLTGSYEQQKDFIEKLNRPHAEIKEITVHNTANNSIGATIGEFRRQGSLKSAHLVVSNDEIIQCVPKNNTAFTNGKHESNIESFTIEFLDDTKEERYIEVLREVSKALGVEKIGKHRDHFSTKCPAKLSDEQFAEILAKIQSKTEVEKGINTQKGAERDMSQNVEMTVNNDSIKEIKKMEDEIKKNLARIQSDADFDELREMIPKKWRCGLYIFGECLALVGATIIAYSAGVRLSDNEAIGIASAFSTVGMGFVGIIKMTKGKKNG